VPAEGGHILSALAIFSDETQRHLQYNQYALVAPVHNLLESADNKSADWADMMQKVDKVETNPDFSDFILHANTNSFGSSPFSNSDTIDNTLQLFRLMHCNCFE